MISSQNIPVYPLPIMTPGWPGAHHNTRHTMYFSARGKTYFAISEELRSKSRALSMCPSDFLSRHV